MESPAGDVGDKVSGDQRVVGAVGPKTVAILGAGVMGSTLLSGLIRSGRVAAELVITGRNAERAEMLAGTYGVRLMSNIDAAQVADTLVLVVKPQDMEGLLAEIRGHVAHGALVVSLAAGITTAFLEDRLPVGTAVVRVMPNTPALVDEGMAALSPGRHCDEVHLVEAEELLRSCGKVLRVAEKHQDAVTAISGAAQTADTLVLVVKPQDMEGLLAEIRGHVAHGALVVSLAAGITTAFLEDRLPVGTAVVRVMPNTPALVDEGMAALSPGRHCDEVHLVEAEELLRSCGKVLRVAEKHQDAVTAISGSGPAYIFYVVEAMIEAGVLLGMPRTTSTELVVQTLYGAATMLKETGQHPTVLREQVSSPGGTTMAALRQLDDHKVRAAFVTAIEAAAERSKQLASGST